MAEAPDAAFAMGEMDGHGDFVAQMG